MARTARKTKKESRQMERIEHNLKTKFISFLMLILASSIVLWFTSFSDIALLSWVLIAIFGGYVILTYGMFVSKAIVVLSAVAMEVMVLNGFSDIYILGSPGNVLAVSFLALDAILVYALSKL